MAHRIARAGRCTLGAIALSLAALLTLAGCGEKSITQPPAPQPPPQPGNIVIDTQPDSLNAPWRLTGPSGYALSGQADTTLIGMTSGEYLITWDAVGDWSPPFAQKNDLAAGGEIRFQGTYSLDNPFAGLEFGTDATLEVVTWNLEHFPKNDLVTVDLVARAIMAMDVDLLALQEIESAFYFGDLDDKLAGWSGILASGSGFNINLAYLYRNSGDWVVDSVREILTLNDREFPRAPYVMEGRFKGTSVVVINNHFKCCGDNYISIDPWDEETRRRDAGIILDAYVRDNFPGRKVIIVGDMNDSLTDSPANNVFNVFLDDPDTWRFLDMAIAQGPSSGWSFPGWPSHLDHILVTAPLFGAVENPAAAVSVLPVFAGFPGGWNEYDRNLSDHLPVAVKLIP
jgi:endonuclease/exonuclease/phosphatase family metal-dependent hydrolase